mmetsp:Transcript_27688/g.69818  ORF Transcript_27688/g.69818 Transcript_27688/m.69818 type:complete len:307 (+) Transcript_27688:2113-3033(+)
MLQLTVLRENATTLRHFFVHVVQSPLHTFSVDLPGVFVGRLLLAELLGHLVVPLPRTRIKLLLQLPLVLLVPRLARARLPRVKRLQTTAYPFPALAKVAGLAERITVGEGEPGFFLGDERLFLILEVAHARVQPFLHLLQRLALAGELRLFPRDSFSFFRQLFLFLFQFLSFCAGLLQFFDRPPAVVVQQDSLADFLLVGLAPLGEHLNLLLQQPDLLPLCRQLFLQDRSFVLARFPLLAVPREVFLGRPQLLVEHHGVVQLVHLGEVFLHRPLLFLRGQRELQSFLLQVDFFAQQLLQLPVLFSQ